MAPAPKEQLQGLFTHLEEALEARGYFRPQAKKPKMVDNLRAVLTRPGFAEPELKVLRGVVASLDYFSPREPRGAGYPERKAKADASAHRGVSGAHRGASDADRAENPDDDDNGSVQTGKGVDNG